VLTYYSKEKVGSLSFIVNICAYCVWQISHLYLHPSQNKWPVGTVFLGVKLLCFVNNEVVFPLQSTQKQGKALT